MAPDKLLFDRMMSRSRSWLLTLGICVGLLGLPFLAATLDGTLWAILETGKWRVLCAPVAVSTYILLIAPPLERVGEGVLAALRSITTLSEVEFQTLVQARGTIKPAYELLIISIGAAIGLWLGNQAGFDVHNHWLRAYWILCNGLMWGLLTWTIAVSFISTRVTTAAHDYLGPIDIFDLSPFEPIGRQSLLLALVFVGGITLGLFFSFDFPSLNSWEFWMIYLTLAAVPVLVFFLNMRSTHRVLAEEKNRQLTAVQRQIQPSGFGLLAALEENSEGGASAQKLSALLAYEQRLKEARTWPYNTSVIRSLFFSVLIPLATMLVRLLIEVIIP